MINSYSGSLKILSSIVLMILTIVEECCLQSDPEFKGEMITYTYKCYYNILKF